MTEAQIYEELKRLLIEKGIDNHKIYGDVKTYAYNNADRTSIDMVVIDGEIVSAYEIKKNWSDKLFTQCIDRQNYADYVYAVGITRPSILFTTACRAEGIGIITLFQTFRGDYVYDNILDAQKNTCQLKNSILQSIKYGAYGVGGAKSPQYQSDTRSIVRKILMDNGEVFTVKEMIEKLKEYGIASASNKYVQYYFADWAKYEKKIVTDCNGRTSAREIIVIRPKKEEAE